MKKIVFLLLALLMVTVLCAGCGASKNDFAYDSTMDMIAPGYDAGYPEAEESLKGSVALGQGTSSTLPEMDAGDYEAKIIKSYQITAETKAFDDALKKLEALISENGGYIESSRITGRNLNWNKYSSRYATYTLRIPAESVEIFIDSTENLVHITSSGSTAENVTSQYYDLQSRVEVFEAERIALNEMLKEATSVETMLQIREQLSNVIANIESLKTQLKIYDSLVSYSTVSLTIEEVIDYTETPKEDPSWGEKIVDAFKESWVDFAEGFQSFTVFAVYAVPTVLTLAVIGGILVTVLIFVKKKRNKNK